MMQMYSQLSRNEYKSDNTFPSILLHAEKKKKKKKSGPPPALGYGGRLPLQREFESY